MLLPEKWRLLESGTVVTVPSAEAGGVISEVGSLKMMQLPLGFLEYSSEPSAAL